MAAEYKLVTDSTHHHFEETINGLIRQGWRPLGSPSIVAATEDLIHDQMYQAMVKGDDTPNGIEARLEAIVDRVNKIESTISIK